MTTEPYDTEKGQWPVEDRHYWELKISLTLGDAVNEELADSRKRVRALKELHHRLARWDGTAEHDQETGVLRVSLSFRARDFQGADHVISEVLFALGASPQRVIVLSAVRGRRVAL